MFVNVDLCSHEMGIKQMKKKNNNRNKNESWGNKTIVLL